MDTMGGHPGASVDSAAPACPSHGGDRDRRNGSKVSPMVRSGRTER